MSRFWQAELPKSIGLGALGVYVGLFLPDLDLLALPLMHHRSIITHSLLLPFIAKYWLPKPVFAGLAAGVSIHLWADSLSTSQGFAQIYLPIVKTGIGGSASFAWLLINAAAGLFGAISAYRRLAWLLVVAYLSIAFAYAVFNEGAAFISYVLAVSGLILFVWRRRRRLGTESSDDV